MLNAYFVDTIIHKKTGGVDKYGEPSAATSVTIKGYIDRKTRLVRTNPGGEQVVSSAMILVSDSNSIDHEDKFYFDGVDHVILEIREIKHFSKTHYEVYVA
jgi:hypothetical protein